MSSPDEQIHTFFFQVIWMEGNSCFTKPGHTKGQWVVIWVGMRQIARVGQQCWYITTDIMLPAGWVVREEAHLPLTVFTTCIEFHWNKIIEQTRAWAWKMKRCRSKAQTGWYPVITQVIGFVSFTLQRWEDTLPSRKSTGNALLLCLFCTKLLLSLQKR